MPPIKLSRISFPPPRPQPTPGAPTAPPPAPPTDAAPTIPGVDPTAPGAGSDLPVTPPTDPTAGSDAAAGSGPVDVDVPTELVDRVWQAVETVPGLTIQTVLTLALQQFLSGLPHDFEREQG